MSDSLGDRMKEYEKVGYNSATRRLPLVVRVDGRTFHTLTRNFKKPYDDHFIISMVASAKQLASEMQGFKCAYIQSDEASFALTDYDTIQTQGWFNYEFSKVNSISAATMSVYFNDIIDSFYKIEKPAVFDCRSFSIPHNEVVNYFLWRAKDWERNSLQMLCRSFFSHKELHKKKRSDMHEMLHSIGQNWANLKPFEKNGVFLINNDGSIEECHDILPNFQTIHDKIGKLFEYP